MGFLCFTMPAKAARCEGRASAGPPACAPRRPVRRGLHSQSHPGTWSRWRSHAECVRAHRGVGMQAGPRTTRHITANQATGGTCFHCPISRFLCSIRNSRSESRDRQSRVPPWQEPRETLGGWQFVAPVLNHTQSLRQRRTHKPWGRFHGVWGPKS